MTGGRNSPRRARSSSTRSSSRGSRATEPRIIAAIIAAHRRGVLVTVILDKSSPSQKGEGADLVHDAGIPTFIDRKPKIAHNKVVLR
jgi:hypothetical protein